MVRQWISWVRSNRARWRVISSGLIGFLAFAASLAWLFILVARWSREHQTLQAFWGSHFLYDLLVGFALCYLAANHVRLLKWVFRLPSPEQQARLESRCEKRAGMLRAAPKRQTDSAEELEAADLLDEVRAFIHKVTTASEAREKETAAAAAGSNG